MRYITFFILLIVTTIINSCTKKPNFAVESNNKIVVCPSPCVDICKVSLFYAPRKNYTITIFDTDGNELKKVHDLPGYGSLTLDMSNQPEGKYIAIASNGIDSYSETFLKIKP